MKRDRAFWRDHFKVERGSPRLRDMKQKRTKLGEDARGILNRANDSGRDLTSSEEREFDELMDAKEALEIVIGEVERSHENDDTDDRIRSEDNAPGRGGDDKNRLGGWLRSRLLDVDKRDDYHDTRALGTGATSGGFLVPTELSKELIDKLRAVTVLGDAGARVVPLNTSKTSVPKVTGDPTPAWVAEHAPVPESTPTLDEIVFAPKTVAFLTKASLQLVQDGLDVEERLASIFINTMAREIDRVGLLGSGVGEEPLGLNGTTGIGTVSMGANGAALASYSPLLNARQLVLDANADMDGRNGDSRWVMAPRTETDLNDLKDSTAQPMQRPPALDKARFLRTTGVPVNQSQGTATNASSIFTGLWSDLWIGVRQDISIIPLRERYMENLQVGWITYARVDVQVTRAPSFARIIGVIP